MVRRKVAGPANPGLQPSARYSGHFGSPIRPHIRQPPGPGGGRVGGHPAASAAVRRALLFQWITV